MYKVSIEPHWRIARGKKPSMDTAMLLRLLGAIQSEGAILQAARNLGLSYRHAWGPVSYTHLAFPFFSGKIHSPEDWKHETFPKPVTQAAGYLDKVWKIRFEINDA